LLEHGKKPTEKGPLTSWRLQREELVKTQKEPYRARPTHFLETAGGETCQDTQRNQLSEAHSRTEDDRGRDLSGHGKISTE
jgi:hypothetical protein